MIFRKKLWYFRIFWEKILPSCFFLGSYFNANEGMGISVTEIQTILHIWACCNQIQQYSPFIIYTMWLMFNKMADDVPSEPRTNQTVVSLLDQFRPPAPNGLSWTLPVFNCSDLVFLDADGYMTVNKADFMWNCLEFFCMLYKSKISWNLLKFVLPFFTWQAIFLCFYYNIYEMKASIFEIFRTKIGNFRKHIQAIFVIFVPTIVGLTGALNDGFHLNALKTLRYSALSRARKKASGTQGNFPSDDESYWKVARKHW